MRLLLPAATRPTLATASYLFVLLVALLPRVLALGQFVTADEASFWMARSELFLDALRAKDFAATAISVHPGVTTMWLGSAGLLLRDLLLKLGLPVGSDFAMRLALLQLPVALVHSAGIVAGYGLLRRLLPTVGGLLAALLWAADPFVIGYSRLLHTDALAATFCTLSLLAACSYWFATPRLRLLVFSAMCAALAVLSKSPALVLVPVVVLLAFVAGGRRAWRLLLLWGALALCTAVLLWPALWAAPMRVFDLLQAGVMAEGAQPHQRGNFFLGRALGDEDPGPLLYPLALVLRTTPWALAGLLLLPLTLRHNSASASKEAQGTMSRTRTVLIVFVLLFIMCMSLFPKKFNRYLLPVFPAVDILAAMGLYASWQLIGGWLARWRIGAATVATTLLVALALGNLLAWHPYQIAAFNQALGGAEVGAEAFQVGWGEGYEQAAAWLNAQPDITGVVVATQRTEMLQAYLRDGAQATAPLSDAFPQHSGYAVVYLRDVQSGEALPPFNRLFGRAPPAHVVRIHGVDYAWIYQLPPSIAWRRSADFGAHIRLRGYNLEASLKPGAASELRLVWHTSTAPSTDYSLFVHVIGPDGQRYAQLDPPLGTRAWSAQRFYTSSIPLRLPPDAPTGRYVIYIGLYDPRTGQRLMVSDAARAAADDGPDALRLTEVVVE